VASGENCNELSGYVKYLASQEGLHVISQLVYLYITFFIPLVSAMCYNTLKYCCTDWAFQFS